MSKLFSMVLHFALGSVEAGNFITSETLQLLTSSKDWEPCFTVLSSSAFSIIVSSTVISSGTFSLSQDLLLVFRLSLVGGGCVFLLCLGTDLSVLFLCPFFCFFFGC